MVRGRPDAERLPGGVHYRKIMYLVAGGWRGGWDSDADDERGRTPGGPAASPEEYADLRSWRAIDGICAAAVAAFELDCGGPQRRSPGPRALPALRSWSHNWSHKSSCASRPLLLLAKQCGLLVPPCGKPVCRTSLDEEWRAMAEALLSAA
jgi:hypothetical protein